MKYLDPLIPILWLRKKPFFFWRSIVQKVIQQSMKRIKRGWQWLWAREMLGEGLWALNKEECLCENKSRRCSRRRGCRTQRPWDGVRDGSRKKTRVAGKSHLSPHRTPTQAVRPSVTIWSVLIIPGPVWHQLLSLIPNAVRLCQVGVWRQ